MSKILNIFGKIPQPLLIGLAFFCLGILTLPGYGINWDTINHAPRGQSYLNYFLTGSENFKNLPKFEKYWQKTNTVFFDTNGDDVPKVSLYQDAGVDFEYFVKNDGGHPPLSDILASFFNFVLFQKLGIINDIDSYRIYGIFVASCLVGLIFFWVKSLYGSFAGLIASLSLSLYPLFWAESHFNSEKDIPEAAFIGFLLYCLWRGVNNKDFRFILLSGVFFGLALGTKFNVLFIPFIIIPWLGFFLIRNKWGVNTFKKLFVENKKFLFSFFVAPLIGLGIFFAFWPYLWSDPINNLKNVLGFYQEIGVTNSFDQRFISYFGVNLFPVLWIFLTTPLVILFLSLIGFIFGVKKFWFEKNGFIFLVFLWLVIPILRVSWPGTSIYGGVRQIMEYIPALAILAGLGVFWINLFLTKTVKEQVILKIGYLLIFLAFLPLIIKLIEIHPFENVYFNPLIGGLKGAKTEGIPYWGNSFGGAYREGVEWINNNSPQYSRVAYARELIPNIPGIWFRKDLALHNNNRSGVLRKGEYIISLTYQGTDNNSYFTNYLNRYLIPVYQAKVDDVAIMKIWLNDTAHTKQEFLNEQEYEDFKLEKTDKGIKIDLGKNLFLSKLTAEYTNNNECGGLKSGSVSVSPDGKNWGRLPGVLPKEDWSVPQYGDQPTGNSLLVPFAAEYAKYISLELEPKDSCLLENITNIRIFYLPDVKMESLTSVE